MLKNEGNNPRFFIAPNLYTRLCIVNIQMRGTFQQIWNSAGFARSRKYLPALKSDGSCFLICILLKLSINNGKINYNLIALNFMDAKIIVGIANKCIN